MQVELFDGAMDAAASGDAGPSDAGRLDGGSFDGGSLSDRDPEQCGVARRECEDDEYCVAGACVCRDPLQLRGGRCVDPDATASHCGAADLSCPSLCADGTCVSSCPTGTSLCGTGCFELSDHPLHCGECGRPCESHAVCVDGECRQFTPTSSCATCGAGTCCSYPGHPADLICVAYPHC